MTTPSPAQQDHLYQIVTQFAALCVQQDWVYSARDITAAVSQAKVNHRADLYVYDASETYRALVTFKCLPQNPEPFECHVDFGYSEGDIKGMKVKAAFMASVSAALDSVMTEDRSASTLSEGDFLVRLEIVTREARGYFLVGMEKTVPVEDTKLKAALAARGPFSYGFGALYKSYSIFLRDGDIIITRTK